MDKILRDKCAFPQILWLHDNFAGSLQYLAITTTTIFITIISNNVNISITSTSIIARFIFFITRAPSVPNSSSHHHHHHHHLHRHHLIALEKHLLWTKFYVVHFMTLLNVHINSKTLLSYLDLIDKKTKTFISYSWPHRSSTQNAVLTLLDGDLFPSQRDSSAHIQQDITEKGGPLKMSKQAVLP